MILKSRHLACGFVVAVVLFASIASGADLPSVDFSRDVLPILSDKCLLCHGPDANARKAELRLDQKESALRAKDRVIVPGQSGKSELIARILSSDPEEVMPPKKSGRSLTPQQIDTLKRWIDGGAAWGNHWAFSPVKKTAEPKVKNSDWPRNPIDRFVVAKLESEGLKPSLEASRTTLIRRLSLDLTGLPPTPSEVDLFLSDTAPDAYERLVERLLASPRYGERMAIDWLDQARFADTNGYQNDFARSMSPWRDWVIAAFNRNLAYDQFVIEQIAGDLLPNPTLDQRIATGFNRNNRTVTEAGSIEEEWRVENTVDRVETTSTVFLGLTMGCVRCHDHKFDPIAQTEFYQFYGFFNSVNEKGVYTETRGNVPPLVKLPSLEDQADFRRIETEISSIESKQREAEKSRAPRQLEWEKGLSKSPAPSEPKDLAWRLPVDAKVEGKKLTSIDTPSGKGFSFNGQAESFFDAGQPYKFETKESFSYGAWVNSRGDGAALSVMDDAKAYRGIDLLLDGAKVTVHLVSTWPTDAIKVSTREPIALNAWTHVFVSYDGSSKAAGVSIWIDGKPAKLDVLNDNLKGSIATDQPLRLGKRSTSSFWKGSIADARVYRRAVKTDYVTAIISSVFTDIANFESSKRTKPQQNVLDKAFRDRFDPEAQTLAANLEKLKGEKTAVEARIPTVMVMEEMTKPRETFVLKRGQYQSPDPARKVEPGVPACLPPLPEGTPKNRLGLARWLVAPNQPLTPRVAVNRIWEQHFGTGLVKTSENFGLQADRPSHPELLDWLAADFIQSGWNLKALHRTIVLSATYRQASKASADLTARDPENRLLARGPRNRLPAEMVRDNALAISGLLVEKIGGPSIKPYQPNGLWEDLAGGAGEGKYVQETGPGLYRRSLYVYRKRTVPHPAMANFDAPSREICQVKRTRTNTPLQALELLNDITYVESARALAQRMMMEGGRNTEERLTYAFRRATSRAPSKAELAILLRSFDKQHARYAKDKPAAEAMIKNGESSIAPGLDPVDLAAYTATAGVILNLDETLTKE